MPKQELLPPMRPNTPATVTVRPPVVNTGGPISSLLTRWEAGYQARAIDALTTRTNAVSSLMDARAKAVESLERAQRAVLRLQELPEIHANELAIRRTERANALRSAQHRFEMDEIARQEEYARAETKLVDAVQQRDAQRKYGASMYELNWKKTHLDMLNVEMNAAECRAVLRQHRIDLENGLSGDTPDRFHREQAEALADGDEREIRETLRERFRR